MTRWSFPLWVEVACVVSQSPIGEREKTLCGSCLEISDMKRCIMRLRRQRMFRKRWRVWLPGVTIPSYRHLLRRPWLIYGLWLVPKGMLRNSGEGGAVLTAFCVTDFFVLLGGGQQKFKLIRFFIVNSRLGCRCSILLGSGGRPKMTKKTVRLWNVSLRYGWTRCCSSSVLRWLSWMGVTPFWGQ